jgi:hypothetical protein
VTTSFDGGLTLADRMRRHAQDHTHLYGELMRAMADDWEAGGPVRDICRGWEEAPTGAVVQLRLLAGLFRIVLTGRAPELQPYYPCLGGDTPASEAWEHVRPVLAAHVGELHDALDVAPQTNEIGRSTALVVGLFEAVRRTGLTHVRLLEPGASAGLNLLVDRIRFVGTDWAFGPEDSPLVMSDCFEGPVVPEDFTVVERRGCDLEPVDATTDEGALRLRSFVWPFHLDRHDRLVHALELARANPPRVDRASASGWLVDQLAYPPDDGILTVVWQSITRQYWPAEEVAAVGAAIRDAITRMPLAWIAMEYPDGGTHAHVTLSGLAGDGSPSSDDVLLGHVGDHGVPMVTPDGRTAAAKPRRPAQ